MGAPHSKGSAINAVTPAMSEADASAPPPYRRPRLDVVSEAWLASYRDLAPVRPTLSARALGAEVEQHLTGVAA